MTRRFYLPKSYEHEALILQGGEAHHLTRVLRLQSGDEVVVFDGQGGEALTRIEALADDRVELRVCERRTGRTESAIELTLAVAVPKGDRFDWLVEKATELGVARLVPLRTARSVVDPRESKLDRLRKTIVEASKQCNRSRLMELTAPADWTEFLEAYGPTAQGAGGNRLWIADPAGDPVPLSGLAELGAGENRMVAAIGPEGGFTADELERGRQSGARLVSLGPRILRIETAAVALAALAALTPPAAT